MCNFPPLKASIVGGCRFLPRNQSHSSRHDVYAVAGKYESLLEWHCKVVLVPNDAHQAVKGMGLTRRKVAFVLGEYPLGLARLDRKVLAVHFKPRESAEHDVRSAVFGSAGARDGLVGNPPLRPRDERLLAIRVNRSKAGRSWMSGSAASSKSSEIIASLRVENAWPLRLMLTIRKGSRKHESTKGRSLAFRFTQTLTSAAIRPAPRSCLGPSLCPARS
jgi:hypothetical protein